MYIDLTDAHAEGTMVSHQETTLTAQSYRPEPE